MKRNIILIVILFMCNIIRAQTVKTERPIIISGSIWSAPNDTIVITYYPYKLGNIGVGGITKKFITNNGSFNFILPDLQHPYYCSITSTRWKNLLLNDQLLESGDSLLIRTNSGPTLPQKRLTEAFMNISGRNADKNQLIHDWEFARRYNKIAGITPIIVNNYPSLSDGLIIIETNRVKYKNYLDSLMNAIPNTLSTKVKAALLNDLGVRAISGLLSIYSELVDKYTTKYFSSADLQQLHIDYEKIIDPILLTLFNEYNFEICSPDFLKMAVQKTIIDTRLKKAEDGMIPALNYLTQAEKWPQHCRQEVITALIAYFYHHNANVGNIHEMLVRILPLVQKTGLKDVLENYQKIYSPGALIYPFELEGINGKQVRIRDFKDKTIVIDFWFTGCRACIAVSRYLKMMKERVAEDTSIVFMSVSIDKDKATWQKSVREGIYTHSDFVNVYTNGEGSEHPFISYYGITSYPHVLIVGRDNKLFTSNPPLSNNKNDMELFIQTILDAGKK